MGGVDGPRSGKPNRSEDLGTPDEQEQHALEARAFLEANAPKRHLKPARSDAADLLSTGQDEDNDTTFDQPERMKYLDLLANNAPLQTMGSGELSEDYTESEYYQYMAAIDKQHHTTGNGFIKVDKTPGGFHLTMNPSRSIREGHGCNPAMNDWHPAPDTTVSTSKKPLRSESSSDYE